MRRSSAAVGLVVVSMLLLSAFAATRLTSGAGQPLYPDLQTLPPGNLSLRTQTMEDGQSHYLVRFDNTVGNWGGRLEIVADLEKSRDLFQNVYDAYSGGNLVSTTRIDSDLIFHPTHNHFHFQDFASYLLLKKDANGDYLPTTRRGTKTSFCIVDTIRVAQIGSGSSSNNTCTAKKQGLSPGWGDVYTAGLPEQWIDMGTSIPADGDYAVQSTADAKDKLQETNENNNTAVTEFSIRGGKLTTTTTTPACILDPATGPVGTAVNLSCERLVPGEKLDLRWNSATAPILKTITVNDQGNASGSLVIPESSLGPHYVHAISQTTGRATLALFTTSPAMALNKTSGTVGSPVGINLTGFAPGEKVSVRYTTTGSTTTSISTVTVNALGSGAGTGTVPVSALGAHKVEAKGGTSKKVVTSSFSVVPSMTLNLASVTAGKKVAPTLRGFQKSETVTISIPGQNLTLKSIRTSSTGSANGTSSNSFTIPKTLAPGDYVIQARGNTSGMIVTAPLTVTAAPTTRSVQTASEDEPSPTIAAPEPSATSLATPETTATEVVEPTTMATEEPTPTRRERREGGASASDDGTPET